MVQVDRAPLGRPEIDRFAAVAVEGVPGLDGPAALAIPEGTEHAAGLAETGRVDQHVEIEVRPVGDAHAFERGPGPLGDDEGDPGRGERFETLSGPVDDGRRRREVVELRLLQPAHHRCGGAGRARTDHSERDAGQAVRDQRFALALPLPGVGGRRVGIEVGEQHESSRGSQLRKDVGKARGAAPGIDQHGVQSRLTEVAEVTASR